MLTRKRARTRFFHFLFFHSALKGAGVLDDVKSIGSYQYNHLWIMTLSNLSTKYHLLQSLELTVKEKRCMVVDPNKAELPYCLSYHLRNSAIKETLEKCQVEEDMRETLRVPGFQGIKSTTKNVRLVWHDDITLNQLPHQLLLQGCTKLVLVPGRLPQCLRCRHTGHITSAAEIAVCPNTIPVAGLTI